jgi:hypothetical protein
MGGFSGFAGELGNVAAHSLQLPGETFGAFGIDGEGKQLIHQPGYQVSAKSQPSRAVLLLLALKPSPFEKGLVGKNL